MRLAMCAMGLCGEAGEFIELVKKHLFHGKDLDRDLAAKELGDVLWYLAVAADAIGFSLDKIATWNVAKLVARYPDGFVSGGGAREGMASDDLLDLVAGTNSEDDGA